MKKTLIALAALAVVSAASAQSSVTIYGVVDMGIAQLKDSVNGGGDYVKNGVQQGTMSNSRIGFKGTEDLGAGLKANFVYELQISPDENVQALTNRLATVGLSGGFGAVTIGRQYSPYWVVQNAVDLVGNLNYTPGYVVNNHLVDSGRVSNSVQYASPSFGGFSVIAQVGAGTTGGGTEAANGAAQAGKSFGLAGIYGAGPLLVGAAYNDVTNPGANVGSMSTITGATPYGVGGSALASFGSGASAVGTLVNANGIIASNEVKVWAAGGSYDFRVVKASLAYSSLTDQKTGGVQDLTSKGWNASISAPLGAVTLAANLGRANVQQADLGLDGTITGYQLLANYALSKRTTAYATFGRDKTEGNNGTELLVRTSTAVGIRHTF